MRLTHFFIDRPRFAVVLSAFVTLLGLGALAVLPVAQYPEVVPPTVQVTTSYPGASAQTVARTARATRFGVADVRRAICVIDFSIPFFINTSTRCEFGFSLVADTTQRMWPPVMSHPNDVGISRQYRPSIPDLYPDLDFRTV